MGYRMQPNAALAELLARDQEAGFDVFDHGPRPAPGPPMTIPPLTRPVIPPADWRAEAEAQARRENLSRPDPAPPPPESLRSLPARRRRRQR